MLGLTQATYGGQEYGGQFSSIVIIKPVTQQVVLSLNSFYTSIGTKIHPNTFEYNVDLYSFEIDNFFNFRPEPVNFLLSQEGYDTYGIVKINSAINFIVSNNSFGIRFVKNMRLEHATIFNISSNKLLRVGGLWNRVPRTLQVDWTRREIKE